MAMTEKQIALVKKAQIGDVPSFEELYGLYYNKVFGFARLLLRNESDAEDVLQETFVTAYNKLNTLKEPATFSVWIQIIAKNLCYMQLRRKNLAILLDAEQDIENFENVADDDALPSVYSERADLREELGKIIESLSEVQRQTIILYYFNELTVEEIAEMMECSVGTVKSRLYLGRNAIKAEIVDREHKSGEKFYGVVGIPLLPFAKVILNYMEANTISNAAAQASLKAITSLINQPGLPVAAATSAGTATATVSQSAVVTKVVATITALATVGAGISLVLIVNGNSAIPPKEKDKTNSNEVSKDYTDIKNIVADIPKKEALDELYKLLDGYWIDQDTFMGFSKENNKYLIEYGAYRSGFYVGGEVFNSVSINEYKIELQLDLLLGLPEDSEDTETKVSVFLDVSGLTKEKPIIKIKVEGIGDGEWYSYNYGGKSLAEAYGDE